MARWAVSSKEFKQTMGREADQFAKTKNQSAQTWTKGAHGPIE